MLCTTKADEFDIVISDFGLAKRLVPGMEITTPCGTSGYVGNFLKKFIFFLHFYFYFVHFIICVVMFGLLTLNSLFYFYYAFYVCFAFCFV